MAKRPLIDLGLLAANQGEVSEEGAEETEEVEEIITSIDASEAVDFLKNRILKVLVAESKYVQKDPTDLLKEKLPSWYVEFFSKAENQKNPEASMKPIIEIGNKHKFWGMTKAQLGKATFPQELVDYYMTMRDTIWNESARAFRKVEVEGVKEWPSKEMIDEVLFLLNFCRVVMFLPIMKRGGDADNPAYAPDDPDGTPAFMQSDKFKTTSKELGMA